MNSKITAIEGQKKNPNRVSIYLDGEYAFGLARIVAAWLTPGMELSEGKILELQNRDEEETAFQKAVHYISYRPRSIEETRKKLRSYGFDENVIDKVVENLCEKKLLCDEQFAGLWIENRMTFRPRSRRMLASELRRKGIPDDTIQTAIEGTDDDAAAYQLGMRFLRRNEGIEWSVYRRKLSEYLARRGFHFETIQSVLHKAWSDHHEIQTEKT